MKFRLKFHILFPYSTLHDDLPKLCSKRPIGVKFLDNVHWPQATSVPPLDKRCASVWPQSTRVTKTGANMLTSMARNYPPIRRSCRNSAGMFPVLRKLFVLNSIAIAWSWPPIPSCWTCSVMVRNYLYFGTIAMPTKRTFPVPSATYLSNMNPIRSAVWTQSTRVANRQRTGQTDRQINVSSIGICTLCILCMQRAHNDMKQAIN